MLNKRYYLSLICLICVICGLLIGAKSCASKSGNKTKSGSSSSSNNNTFTLNAPSNLGAALVSGYQIDISWFDNSNNEDGFEIERSLNGTTYYLLTTTYPNITLYSDTTVTPENAYYYRIRAFNTIGDRSEYSNIANLVTFDYNWIPLFSSVAAGASHSVAVGNDGSLWSWGRNDYWQLGLGDNRTRFFPNLIASDVEWNAFNGIADITADFSAGYCVARKTDNTLWGWGANGAGQLGLGDFTIPPAPAQMGSDSDWSLFAVGEGHTLAIKNNNTLWATGYNNRGQLGLGDSGGGTSSVTDRNTLTQVGTDSDWSMVAGGFWHSLSIKNTGTLLSWGFNSNGQLGHGDQVEKNTPTQAGTQTDWSQITAGFYHSLGIKNNGTIWAWGGNNSGQLGIGVSGSATFRKTPVQIGTETDWSKVDAGYEHTAGIKNTGTLWAWGENSYRQLGLGDNNDRNTPSQVGTDTDWMIVKGGRAGIGYGIGLKTNGIVWTWGNNSWGQLGLGNTVPRYIPCALGSPLAPSSATVSVKSPSNISLSWTDNSWNESGFKIERMIGTGGTWGEIRTVGINIGTYADITVSAPNVYYYRVCAFNLFGNSPYSNEVTPALNTPSVFIATVISSTQINLTWNYISSEEEGFKIERKTGSGGSYAVIDTVAKGITSYSDISPSGFSSISYYYRVKAFNSFTGSSYSDESHALFSDDWIDATGGEYFTIAKKSDGTLWTWGFNAYGQLGLGDANFNRITPARVGTETDWLIFSAGRDHAIALKTNGTAWSWGRGLYGALGLADISIDRLTPTQIGNDSDWFLVKCGLYHNLAMKNDRTIWTWGRNDNGQLGLGNSGSPATDRNIPTQIGPETDWAMIDAGSQHCLALKSNGILFGWGRTSNGELGIGDTINRNTPIQLNSDNDWSVIFARGANSGAFKTDGTLWVWGRNNKGQLGLGYTSSYAITPTLLAGSGWVSAFIEMDSISAKKNNGTTWAWGWNNYGELGLGDTIDRYTPTQIGIDSDWTTLKAGYYHSLVIKSNGTLWSWGYNNNGQLGLGDSGTGTNRLIPTVVGE